MNRESGTTVVELLVGSGVLLAAAAAVFTLVADATARSASWNDAADLHQRARVAADAISRHLAAAGAGLPNADRRRRFPAIEPRRRSSFLTSDSALTVRHVPERAAWTTVTSDVPPGAVSANVTIHGGCPAGVPACGFGGPLEAVILDVDAGWHLLTVEATSAVDVTVVDRVPGRTATFPAGSMLVELEEASLYFDAHAQTLRQEGPGHGSFPIVDHVASLTFDYFADAFVPLPLSSLVDGPLCGSGALAYDCDLLRIRTVRASFRILSTRPADAGLALVVEATVRRSH